MLIKKRHYLTAGLAALCAITIASCASSKASQVNEKYENPFLDVRETDWFEADVQYANENNLMSGIGDTTFAPNDTTTRGMIVTVLWRLDGQKREDGKTFDDVPLDTYYHDAVAWGLNHSIVSGYDEKTFAPNDAITREQLAAMFYRYGCYKQFDTSDRADLNAYIDVQSISGYAIDAFKWANANGIITGVSENTLEPQGNATRAQLASILRRFDEKYKKAANLINGNQSNEGKEEQERKITDESDNRTLQEQSPAKFGGSRSSVKDGQNENFQNPEPEKYDETAPRIIVNDVSAAAGDNIKVVVDVKNNPGILGMTLTLNYDENVLSLEKVENGEAVKDVLTLTPSQTLKNGMNIVWDGIEINDSQIKDGTILELNFKVNDEVKSGEYPISLSYAEGEIVDNNLSEISVIITNGKIIVK